MIKNIIGYCSRQFQVNLEDSGTTLSTTTNPSINDEKCNQACIFLYFLNRGAIEAIAVFVKLQRLSGESLLEASVSSLCLTGVLRICFHILSSCSSCPYCSFCPQGLQLHHQRGGAANVCREPHFCSLLQQIHQLLGLVRTISAIMKI